MTRLLIARHGNTFAAGEVPLRVGARTDLPLVASGIAQAEALGRYFRSEHIRPDIVYSGHLKRAFDTARIALECASIDMPVTPLAMFNEIDYGPDEAKPEEEVIARIGKEALTSWDKEGIVPQGWNVDPQAIIQNWKDFAEAHIGKNVLVVTSNGIARFAPHITNDFAHFSQHYSIKISTGALCSFTHDGINWDVEFWNKKV
jgi:2,3-bisphosphoglycerate-dependent phosphoglycerate mutase